MSNLYRLEKQDPRYNCAIEKALIDKGDSFLMLATVSPGVFIGRDVSYLAYKADNALGVPVTRYNGTGGPVYFDDGNIKVSFLADIDNTTRAQQLCTAWVARSLQELGVPAEADTVNNDVFLGGKKIGGVGTVSIGNKSFLPFFLSLNIDFEVAAQVMVLTKHTDDLAERSVGINDAGYNLTAETVFDSLLAFYPHYFDSPLVTASVPSDILSAADDNLTVYNSEDWLLYGEQ